MGQAREVQEAIAKPSGTLLHIAAALPSIGLPSRATQSAASRTKQRAWLRRQSQIMGGGADTQGACSHSVPRHPAGIHAYHVQPAPAQPVLYGELQHMAPPSRVRVAGPGAISRSVTRNQMPRALVHCHGLQSKFTAPGCVPAMGTAGGTWMRAAS
eukprot:scaffold41444_cov31-Tisochrysis_lutea.AAC.3